MSILELTYSLAFSAILTEALKKATQEPRPNGAGLSFPSGHTSISFAGAEFLRQHWGWSWGFPAYVAASIVGYSRVASQRHYTHDVIVGAAIGVASNHLHPWKTGHRGWLQLTPRIAATSMHQIGLGLELRW